jgi:hypothetical protein
LLNLIKLEREEQYADVIINHEPDFNEYNRSAVFLNGCIDLDFWRPDLKIPNVFRYNERWNGEIRIIHAVGGKDRGDVKGSSVVAAVVADLKSKGWNIVYNEIKGISFKDLRWHILQSDIVVDQLRYGSFGSFARESMALGKPVVGHVIAEQRAYLKDLPIVEATVETIGDVLEGLIRAPEARKDLGVRSRAWAKSLGN